MTVKITKKELIKQIKEVELLIAQMEKDNAPRSKIHQQIVKFHKLSSKL